MAQVELEHTGIGTEVDAFRRPDLREGRRRARVTHGPSRPLAQTLESYRQSAGHWLLLDAARDDAWARAEPFESIELGALWAR